MPASQHLYVLGNTQGGARLQQRHDFSQRPDVIGKARFHGRRHAEGVVDAAEVLPRELKGGGRF